MRIALIAFESLAVAVLAALVLLAIGGLLIEVTTVIRPPFLGTQELGRVLDQTLAVFILIELLATAIALIQRRNVLEKILETGLVAIARKLIALDLSSSPLAKAGALGILLVALALAWYLLRQSGAISPQDPNH